MPRAARRIGLGALAALARARQIAECPEAPEPRDASVREGSLLAAQRHVHGAAESHLVGGDRPRAATALILIDTINRLDFPGSRSLARECLPMSRRLERLARRARQARIPVVYVNDNFGRWASDWRRVLEACLEPDAPGRFLAERLQPREGDYFVLKPMHSGFHFTPLDLLLRHLGARTLIVTGIATDICVLFTANDAYMRGYRLFVPADCCAANTRTRHRQALRQLRAVVAADTRLSTRLRFRGRESALRVA
jgi:nicotinamidase-related amidase